MIATFHSRRCRAGLATLGAVLLLSACGSGGGNADTANTVTVAMPAMESQQPESLADPAFFYGGPGISLTNSVYEGLLRYTPGSDKSELQGAVSEKWTISDDGLTYTFQLRDAKFASGASVTAEDAVYSLERFIKLKGGPSYMLAGVEKVIAKDDKTLVIELERPISPLLDYLASPYGPKILEKKVVEENSKGDDGRKWLATHSAGSGPYSIAKWVPNKSYTLTANKNYWEGAPKVPEVVFKVSADAASQFIGLRKGTVDVARIDQPTDLKQVKGSANTVIGSSLLLQVLAIDPTLPPFDKPEIRRAVRAAIDKPTLVKSVWGELGTPSKELLPPGLMEPQDDPDVSAGDSAELAKAVEALPKGDRKVTFYYTTQSADERMAQAIAAVLEEAGLDVELRLPSNGEEWWKTDKVNLYIQTTNPDAAAPDAWMQIFYKTTGFLNYLHGGLESVDGLIDEGQSAESEDIARAKYAEAAGDIYDHSTFVTLASVKNAFGVNKGLTGVTTTPAAAFAVDLSKARK